MLAAAAAFAAIGAVSTRCRPGDAVTLVESPSPSAADPDLVACRADNSHSPGCFPMTRTGSLSCRPVKQFAPVVLSGKGAALLPLPPLRTGRESFPSSGSSRYKAPRERSRFHDDLIPACWRCDAELFVERTFREVVLPLGSNGLASARIFRCRRILVSLA